MYRCGPALTRCHPPPSSGIVCKPIHKTRGLHSIASIAVSNSSRRARRPSQVCRRARGKHFDDMATGPFGDLGTRSAADSTSVARRSCENTTFCTALTIRFAQLPQQEEAPMGLILGSPVNGG
jgi:hypothetical protein